MTTPDTYEAAVTAAASAVALAIEKLGEAVRTWDPGRNRAETGFLPRIEAIERLAAVLISLGPETTVGAVTVRGWDGSSRQLPEAWPDPGAPIPGDDEEG